MKLPNVHHQSLFCYLLIILHSLLLGTPKHEAIFTDIYDNAIWGKNDSGESFSGGGLLLTNSRRYIHFLENFILHHNIKTVVDAGCGDWKFSRYVDWHGASYIGYDVVHHIINKNIRKYTKTNIQFKHANILTAELPPADLLLCKHVLQHLPNDDILLFLKQVKKFKYCLITNEVNPLTLSSPGDDISTGGGHKIDLSKPPFNIIGKKVLNYRIGTDIHQMFLIDNSITPN